PKMRFWNGGFWFYRRGQFEQRRDDETRCELINNLNEKYTGVKPRHASEVTEHLKAKTVLPSRVSSPTWLIGNGDEPDPLECVALRNGILHLPSLRNWAAILLENNKGIDRLNNVPLIGSAQILNCCPHSRHKHRVVVE